MSKEKMMNLARVVAVSPRQKKQKIIKLLCGGAISE